MDKRAASMRVTASEKSRPGYTSIGNTRGLTSMFESMKVKTRKSSQGDTDEQQGNDAKEYYNRAQRQTFSSPARQSVINDNYNAELMAKVAEICEGDRTNDQETNYVDIKTTLVDLFGFDDFVKNKPFVTEYLVSNSRKVTDRSLQQGVMAGSSPGVRRKQPSEKKPLIASNPITNLFTKEVSEEEVRTRVEELCKIANLANKEPQYMTIKSTLNKEFGAKNFDLYKDAITEQLSTAWAPAPPVRRASQVKKDGDGDASFKITRSSTSDSIPETEEAPTHQTDRNATTTPHSQVSTPTPTPTSTTETADAPPPTTTDTNPTTTNTPQQPQSTVSREQAQAALAQKKRQNSGKSLNGGTSDVNNTTNPPTSQRERVWERESSTSDPMMRMLQSEEKHYDYSADKKPRLNSANSSAKPSDVEACNDEGDNPNAYLAQGQEFEHTDDDLPTEKYSTLYAEPAVIIRNQAAERGIGNRAMSVHVRLSEEDSLYMDQEPDLDANRASHELENPYGEATYCETDYAYPDDMMHSLGDTADDQSLRDKAAQIPLDMSGFVKIEVLEYDKDEGGRSRFLIQCKYNREPAWLVHKYYTEFQALSEQMEKSKKLHKFAGGLPEKHGFGLVLKQKLSINPKSTKKQEAEFMITRMEKLQTWLNNFCSEVCVNELQNESCVDEFLELFFRLQG